MKKLNLTNLYESHLPPTRTDVLWVDVNESTGDIRAIHKLSWSKKDLDKFIKDCKR